MDDIKLNNEELNLVTKDSTGELYNPLPSEIEVVNKSANNKKRKKEPRALTMLSLIFTAASLPCALLGLIPFQIFFILLGLVFYIVDRKKNGKRGISLFGMICTLVTFIVIFMTLVYSILLLGFGIYTVYINPEPYNFVMGTFKGFISWFLGIFGINLSF